MERAEREEKEDRLTENAPTVGNTVTGFVTVGRKIKRWKNTEHQRADPKERKEKARKEKAKHGMVRMDGSKKEDGEVGNKKVHGNRRGKEKARELTPWIGTPMLGDMAIRVGHYSVSKVYRSRARKEKVP